MAWDTEMALAIKNTARKAAKSLPKGWYRAEVLQVTPKLIFSVVSKEFQFSTGDGRHGKEQNVEGRHAGGGHSARQ